MNNTSKLSEIKGITFGSLNIRGANNKVDDPKILLKKSGLDILCLQETFLDESTSDSRLSIDSHTLFRQDRNHNICKKTGGGLVTFIGTQYLVCELPTYSVSLPDLEVQWLKLSLKDTRPTYISNIYRPPSGSLETAIEILDRQINDLNSDRVADIVFLGDLNVDLSSNNSNAKKYKRFFETNLLTQLIKTPTRVTNTSRTIIDHIVTSNTEYYTFADTIDPGLSDHHMIFTARKRHKIKRTPSYFIGRSYMNYDDQLLYQDMYSINWTFLYSVDDVDLATQIFTDTSSIQ